MVLQLRRADDAVFEYCQAAFEPKMYPRSASRAVDGARRRARTGSSQAAADMTTENIVLRLPENADVGTNGKACSSDTRLRSRQSSRSSTQGLVEGVGEQIGGYVTSSNRGGCSWIPLLRPFVSFMEESAGRQSSGVGHGTVFDYVHHDGDGDDDREGDFDTYMDSDK